jgi:excinuclease UvrABC ATPase subunit
VELTIPRYQLTVITGVSGSGKSSLAFDTLHAEGSRQYLESLSAKARGMLDSAPRPDVDFIRGLSPVIAIAQRTGGNTNPRSTVATLTEIADHARPLWIIAGDRRCLKDGQPVRRRSLDDNLLALEGIPAGTRLMVVAPVAKDKPSVLLEAAADLGRRGFSRVRVDGTVATLEEAAGLLTGRESKQLDVVVDRIVAGPTSAADSPTPSNSLSAKAVTARACSPRKTDSGKNTCSRSTSPANIVARATSPSAPAPSRTTIPKAPAPTAVVSADRCASRKASPSATKRCRFMMAS